MNHVYIGRLALFTFFICFKLTNIAAQFPKLFIEKTDENIREVVCYVVDNNGDSSEVAYVFNFNTNGQITREAQPEYYIEVNYKYDGVGRLIEEDALYGESFANGTTYFSYKGDTTVAKNMAMGFYSETLTISDNSNRKVKIETYFVAGGMGESKIEWEQYFYNKNNLQEKKKINITFYDISRDVDELQNTEPESLLKALRAAPVLKKEEYIVKYQYNSKNQPVTETLFSLEKGAKIWETEYVYNKSGLLKSATKTCIKNNDEKRSITCSEYTLIKEYNAVNELIRSERNENGYLLQQFYEHGKLIKDIEKYKSSDEVSRIYKYKYYKN